MNLDRKARERLYIEKTTELQTRWGNPISAWDFRDVGEMSDEELKKQTDDAIGQIRFEKIVFGLPKMLFKLTLSAVGVLVFLAVVKWSWGVLFG